MSLKVIIVDDDDTTIYIHKMLVRASQLSAEPVCFSNSTEAINYLDEQYNAADTYLLLLDINMPVIDGWRFLDTIQLKPYADDLSIVLITSSIDIADRNRAAQYKQVIDYVEKPLKKDRCVQILQQMMG